MRAMTIRHKTCQEIFTVASCTRISQPTQNPPSKKVSGKAFGCSEHTLNPPVKVSTARSVREHTHLAIQLDIGNLGLVDEPRVRNPVLPHPGVDSLYPHPVKVPPLVLCKSVSASRGAVEARGGGEDTFKQKRRAKNGGTGCTEPSFDLK